MEPSRSPPPTRSVLPHARSLSTSLPRPQTSSRIPQSPPRTASGSSTYSLDENIKLPPPTFGLYAGSQQSAYVPPPPPYTQSNPQQFVAKHSQGNEMNSSTTMPPPSKTVTASIQKNRSLSLHASDPKRETLAERAARPSGIAPPGSRSVTGSGIAKPMLRSNSMAPSAGSRGPQYPRPKSSFERTRPPSVSGTGMSRPISLTSKTSGISTPRPPSVPRPAAAPRPPSAQELRSARDDELATPFDRRPQSSNNPVPVIDDAFTKRLEALEAHMKNLQEEKTSAGAEKDAFRERYEEERFKVVQLETTRATLESQLSFTRVELENTKQSLVNLTRTLEDERSQRRLDKDDLSRRLEREVEEAKRRARDETESLTKSHREALETAERTHQQSLENAVRQLKQQVEDERAARLREVSEVQTQAALEKQKLETKMDSKWREIRQMKEELDTVKRELDREKILNSGLRDTLAEHSAASLTMETSTRTLKARIELLETDAKEKLHKMLEYEARCNAAEEETKTTKEKLRQEETLRRKLHNQVQELKGNIRVFCRVRPPLGTEAINAAEIKYPDVDKDGREIEVVGPPEKTALGNVLTKTHPFQFDKVFGPSCKNSDVFEEISQLIQSALDGYNVCIFCYGQTGSGKTYTMSADDGMIPRAVHQIYDTAKSLEEKGWTYSMEGSFVEIYNENINDLLGRPDDLDRKKLEIRHDSKELKTTVVGLNSVVLDTPNRVEHILKTAGTNRSVAATKANERSSRSHSVFMLKLTGYNKITGERSEGTLNLVDLAGSERLSHSQASGDRLRETQNINKSLACLGDVISALGSGREGTHIPYRNSKLTYLLQYSLGGNSKTLMFVMVSPLQAHLSESLTSLKFATKVSNTYIGTARKKVTNGDK